MEVELDISSILTREFPSDDKPNPRSNEWDYTCDSCKVIGIAIRNVVPGYLVDITEGPSEAAVFMFKLTNWTTTAAYPDSNWIITDGEKYAIAYKTSYFGHGRPHLVWDKIPDWLLRYIPPKERIQKAIARCIEQLR